MSSNCLHSSRSLKRTQSRTRVALSLSPFDTTSRFLQRCWRWRSCGKIRRARQIGPSLCSTERWIGFEADVSPLCLWHCPKIESGFGLDDNIRKLPKRLNPTLVGSLQQSASQANVGILRGTLLDLRRRNVVCRYSSIRFSSSSFSRGSVVHRLVLLPACGRQL
jgi:hypothetical protein